MSQLPRGLTVRRDAGLYGYERALRRHGIEPIAGVDEAGRGACAGPLVAGACILPPGKAGIVPGLAVWKGDRVAACISAASVLAKVTRDRIMVEMHDDFPHYDFRTHKGYITEVHSAALTEHGPSPVHRMRFVNVRRAAGLEPPLSDSLREPEGGPHTAGEEHRLGR